MIFPQKSRNYHMRDYVARDRKAQKEKRIKRVQQKSCVLVYILLYIDILLNCYTNLIYFSSWYIFVTQHIITYNNNKISKLSVD